MTIESLEKLDSTPSGRNQRWNEEITAAEKELAKFHDSGRRVDRRYRDERDTIDATQRKINIFAENVDILKASLYSNLPTPDVERRFSDEMDDIARTAALILQRAISQDMEEPNCDFDTVMRNSVADRLIPGVGTAWVRLETETEELDEVDEEGEPMEAISEQEVCIDYVYWEDFLWSPCRIWEERRWTARKVPMTRDQCVERFGEKLGKQLPMDYKKKATDTDSNAPKHSVMDRACVYEIWDRENKRVIWFAKGMEQLLDEKDDPLGLEDFEPCPKPMFANMTTSSCVPKADFAMIQDQYNELDDTNNRISLLVQACKVVGVYDRASDGVQRMLSEGTENVLIPVDNWAMFAEKGGIAGQVDMLPLADIITALDQLQRHREAVKGQIYELTGINDIVRGNTKASETLGAQELKANFANVRIQNLQDEVTRFGTDLLQIKAEIMVKHFDPMVLARMANVESIHSKMYVIPALQLIKDGGTKLQWRVKIEAESMAMIDQNRQKTERTEFMNATATFLQSAATVGQNTPEMIPLMLKLLQFGVAGFNISKDLESVFDQYVQMAEEAAAQAAQKQDGPSPEQMKMQAEMEKMKMEMQIKQQEAQLDIQKKQMEIRQDQQQAGQSMQQSQEEFLLKMRQSQQEFEQKMMQMMSEFQLKKQVAVADAKIKQSTAMADARTKQEIAKQQAKEKPANEK